jgi:hypothetical protein
MNFRVILLYSTLLLSVQGIFAQYYDTGQDPASIKWMQIKTGRFTVIYPASYDSSGIAFARSLEAANSKLHYLFPEKKFTIPVVIHSFTAHSNGYVAWAPRRMELYPTPDQNSIPLDFCRQLSIHELTHVYQMESLNTGFSKVMSFILGEQYTGISASFLPLWFLEGDAVFAESVLTESGRGRTASFQKELKAISVQRRRMYKYDKILNGSFRDYIPDHYQSGYQMVTWAMAKYNPQIWNNALKYTADFPFTINPFNISLTQTAGLTKRKLFSEAFDSLNTIWFHDDSNDNTRSYETINPAKRGKYINYYSPVIAGRDSVIAIRTSLSDAPTFVLINPSRKTEKRIYLPGQMYPWFLSYAKGKLVWVETRYDPRWENREYSVIKMLDLRTNKSRVLSRKSRYLSASVSPDGKMIAAIENTVTNKNSLVFLDTETGSFRKFVAAPENVYLQRPQWNEDGEKITVIFLTHAGEGIMSYDLGGEKWETLVKAGKDDLQSSFLKNDSLFFVSSVSGTENIFVMTPGKGKTRLTRSRFGANDLTLAGDKIYFSDYTLYGNDICHADLDEFSGALPENTSSSSFLINRFKPELQTPENISSVNYSPEPYRKWKHLFKFHSWMPFYADLEAIKSDPASVRPGFSLLTQNHLSTLTSSIGYEYSQAKKHVIHSKVTWEGWYPVFESQLSYGNEPLIAKYFAAQDPSVSDPSVILPGLQFTNTVYLPLRFSTGRFSQYFQPSVTTDYANDYVYIKEAGAYDHGQTILSGRIYFSNYNYSSYRDIFPRWAQSFDLNYSFAPFDRNIYGSAASLKSAFYFPGFFKNNGIRIRYEREKQSPVKFMFSNRVSFPRGYKNFKSKDFDFFSADYVLPLFYPDMNISSLLYLKRIRAGLFYDYVSGPRNSFYSVTSNGLTSLFSYTLADQFKKESLKSFGFEILTDFHILRIPYLISGGVQTSWKKLNEKPSFELLFNIDLFGLTIGKRKL